MEKDIRLSDMQKYEENPFYEETFYKMQLGKTWTKHVGAGVGSFTNSSGDTSRSHILAESGFYDKEEFVKYYARNIKEAYGLSTMAMKVFGYFADNLKKDDSEVYLHLPDVIKFCGYKTHVSVYKGLTELVSNNIIAMSEKSNIWYINPSFMFNGDRFTIIKDFMLKKGVDKISNGSDY